MNKLIIVLENINEKVGQFFSWSTTLLVWLIFALVIMRYGFGTFSQKLNELCTYLFAISFLFAGGYALKHNMHVRVDLFYAKWSPKGKAWVNLIGGLLFLLPWSVVSIIVCFRYAYTSFKLGETSQEPSGLAALYVLKFILLIGFVLLLIQGIASILKSTYIILGKDETLLIVKNKKPYE